MAVAVYEQLDQLLRGGEGHRARGLDLQITSRSPLGTITVLTSLSSHLAVIGPLVTTTDREFRRAAAILGDESRRDSIERRLTYTRPVPATAGGLRVRIARHGSLHLLVEAYGAVLATLTSQPMTALVTVLTLGQGVGTIRTWLNHQDSDLVVVDQHGEFEKITNTDGNTSRLMRGQAPDQEIEILPVIGGEESREIEHEQLFQGMPEFAGSVNTTPSGEVIVRGRRITHMRIYPDGTRDIIYVEG